MRLLPAEAREFLVKVQFGDEVSTSSTQTSFGIPVHEVLGVVYVKRDLTR